ncbi:hypothetical protein DRQ25_00415 [Candidatus Fermentibacteria bacterium]|nr:MAG: hypothetical protein DRQ25_00415 [Candidatus Fermentibacteria bacterium]
MLVLLSVVCAQPCGVFGTVYEGDGSTPAVGALVTAENKRTDEIKEYTTLSDGSYGIDFQELCEGGDLIFIQASKEGHSGSRTGYLPADPHFLTDFDIVLGGGSTSTTTTTTSTSSTTTTTHSSGGLSISPSSLEISQKAGEESSYYLTILNNGGGTMITAFVSGIPTDWVSLSPQTFYLNSGETRVIQVEVDIPDDESDEEAGYILVNSQQIPITIEIEKEYYEIIDREWFDEDESIYLDDYEFFITKISSSYIKVDLYEDDDEIEENVRCDEDEETEIGSHFKIEVHDIKSSDEVKLSLYADEELEDERKSYEYTLFDDATVNTGTWLNFEYGQFYLYFNTVADTGARIDYYETAQPQTISCFIGSDCKIGDNILLKVTSITRGTSFGTGMLTVTLKSKNQYMVYQSNTPFQGSQQNTPFPGSQQNTPFPGSQQNNPFQPSQQQQTLTQGNIYISIAGGKIAPNHKVIFYIKDYNNMPVRTGTLTVDVDEPISADINEGLATVRFPQTIECPILITATSAGYQTTPQVFTSCNEEEGEDGIWYSTTGGKEEGGETETEDKLTITKSKPKYYLDDTIELIITCDNKGVDDATVTVEFPDDDEKEYTTDSDGKIEFDANEYGTYKITAEKEDYDKTKEEITIKEKTMSISINPKKPKIGDTVSIAVGASDGSSIKPKITVNGLSLPTNAITLSSAGQYDIQAELEGYETATYTFTIESPATVIHQPENLALNEPYTILLDKPALWTVQRDEEIIESGTRAEITFTPTEPGLYSIIVDGKTTTQYEVGGGTNILSTAVIVFIVIAVIAVLILAKRKQATTVKEAGGLRDKKKMTDVDKIAEKIAKGKDLDVTPYS